MVATIAQIIGKINPEEYAENAGELLKKYKNPRDIPAEEVKEQPLSKHGLVYDSSSETLEPVYFFILDLMNDFRFVTEKLVDNFASSPGSGHFAELGQRATIMQQQGSKILGDVNTVLRSVLNIIYDLKEFRIRLKQYDDIKTKNKDAAILALKQIWMDKVDFMKGNSSIKAMALTQAGFQTLIDAFLFCKDEKDVDKIDLNDRIKRILRPRILEFNDWLGQSEKELRKRYELEKTYLKSQVNSLKLYARWAKPYLRAAQQLEMKDVGREPALVKTFNTILLELTLFGKQEIKPDEEAAAGKLPKEFERLKLKRKYYSCILVEFKFRGIPQRISQQAHYVFGGKAEISFKSYVLNEDEIKKFEEELDSSEMNDVLDLIEGSTGESLDQMQEEINFFLEDKDEFGGSGSQGEMDTDTSNPFFALIGGYDKKSNAPKKEGKGPEKKEDKNWWPAKESFGEKEELRPLGEEKAKEMAFKIFDVYKKAHGMPSYT